METYPFDDVTPDPADAPVEPPAAAAGGNHSRARKIATGAAIGVAVLTTGGVAMAATHSGSTTAQGGPGGGPGVGGPNSESGTTGPGGSRGTPPSGAPAAGTSGGTATTPPTGARRGGPGVGGFGGPGGFGFGGPGGVAAALHGTFVVPATSGTGTVTEDLQTGKVTAVSATSIVVTSTDKSVGTFVVTSTTSVNRGRSKIADVKVGNTVTVIATDADKKALSVEDRTLEPAGSGPRGYDGRPAAGAPHGGSSAEGGTNS